MSQGYTHGHTMSQDHTHGHTLRQPTKTPKYLVFFIWLCFIGFSQQTMVRVQGDIKSFLHNQLVIWTNLYHFDSAWISRPSPEKKRNDWHQISCFDAKGWSFCLWYQTRIGSLIVYLLFITIISFPFFHCLTIQYCTRLPVSSPCTETYPWVL